MVDRLRVPGARDVRAARDGPADTDALVVACPPHPQHGGSRSDSRLTVVADALADRGVACLRIDYGPWDGGRGEVTDAVAARGWAEGRFARVGIFGYSFGAGVALLAAGEAGPAAVSVLAPPASVGGRDVAAAVPNLAVPLQVVYGERDDTVDWRPVVEAAREHGATVEAFGTDHFFVVRRERIGERVATWFDDALRQ